LTGNFSNPIKELAEKKNEGKGIVSDYCTVGPKSHDPCFCVFLMEAGVMTFVTHCTMYRHNEQKMEADTAG